MNLRDAEDRSVAAGEYVLGTLADADRQAFEQALGGDARLRAEVAYWQDRLLALTREAAPATPPRNLWSRIEHRLAPAAAAPVRVWQRLGWWRGLSAAALASCAVLSGLLVLRAQAPLPADRYVAVLQAPGGGGNGWFVEVDTRTSTLRLVPVAGSRGVEVPAGRTLQFWTKAPDAAGPSSLGLVPAGAVTELPAQRLPALVPEQLFEITLEPAGGSPLGRPTGPVLFLGRAVRLDS